MLPGRTDKLSSDLYTYLPSHSHPPSLNQCDFLRKYQRYGEVKQIKLLISDLCATVIICHTAPDKARRGSGQGSYGTR